MKRFVFGFLLAVALLSAYWAWPFTGLHSLEADLQSRDTVALSRDVDFVALRRSLSQQIIAAYLQLTGRASGLGAVGTTAASILVASVADPWVAQMINPENLLKLLNGRAVSTDIGQVALNTGRLPIASLSVTWRAWLNSEYWWDQFAIRLPVDAPPSEQFRIRLQLIQWRWKLTGIDLPEALRMQFAGELAKKYP
jgi:Protein of unknown function (DUF2939)